MSRILILFGFALMFAFIHMQGNLNKYINTKYSYLSVTAIVLFTLLSILEFVRFYRLESEAERRKAEIEQSGQTDSAEQDDDVRGDQAHEHMHNDAHDGHTHEHMHNDAYDGDAHEHTHIDAHHLHDAHHDHRHHDHDHAHEDPFHDHGHAHDNRPGWKRTVGFAILFVPILTGIFLPVQTLDSSFVKAKGFAFPQFEATEDNPGQHQFLKPDTSVYYGAAGYEEVKNKDFAEYKDLPVIQLTDENYLKGMEVIYNFPGYFMDRTISFDGFAYKGDQVDNNHYFVFRFGFIHCAADSGVFGMLVDFPRNTTLANDQWVHVTGTLSWELYQPFKQTIPVLRATEWQTIPTPEDPYVYRNY